MTSKLRWGDAPGNALLLADITGIPVDSAANVSQIVAIDESVLADRVGKIPQAKLDLVLAGIDAVPGRSFRLST